MTNTQETIEKLRNFRDEVREKMVNRELITFNIGGVDIANDTMSVNGAQLSPSATKKVLGRLRVKNNFLELGRKLTPVDWDTVKEKLKTPESDQIVYGRRSTIDGKSSIDDIYLAAPKSGGTLELDTVFGELIDSVVSTTKDYSVVDTTFMEDKDEVAITLLDHGSSIDIFANDSDLWKAGKKIVWNGVNFSVSPYYERLVCSNGNVAKDYGFRANISNNKFNLEKIRKMMEKEITLSESAIDSLLIDGANHLRHTNISVKEFYKYQRMFNETDHGEILKKWFDDTFLNRAYGCIVAEMPDMWQSSADTGKNAYDFFNDLTYIASHPKDVKLTDRERLDLQIKASELIFKKQLDLELLAPKLTWRK